MPLSPRLLRPIASRSLVDADANAYLTAVQTADGQALEPLVRNAITGFVLGCKQDGIWSLLTNTFLFCGARTLAGAIVPLVGPAPTPYNFASGDYNRKTGLKGNGSNKYLLAGITGSQLTQTSHHGFFYGSDFEASGSIRTAFGSSGGTEASLFDLLLHFSGLRLARSGGSGSQLSISSGLTTSGSVTLSRTASNSNNMYQNTSLAASSSGSSSPAFSSTIPLGIFCRNDGANSPTAPTGARFAVFSFGSGLSAANVAALHNRSDALIAALGTAIA